MLTTTIKRILQGIGLLFLFAVVLVIALACYFVISHRQPLTLPSPTGQYRVGRTEYDWVDNSRIDPFSHHTNEKRELLVWVWYPANASQQNPTVPYLPPAWVNARDKDQGIGKDANRIEKVWADDAAFVMDKLQSMNADPSSRFYNKLDLAHVGFFGHSFGGATAFRVCELDVRCKAGADLDGTLWSDEVNATLQQPFMFMTHDACGSNCEMMRQVYSNAKSTAYYLSIKGAKHFNFSDLPLRLSPPARILFNRLGFIGSIQPERGLEIANAYLVAFFDQYLQGVNSRLLQGPSSEYPEVQFRECFRS
jgi:predicted dienelactone hydrolase